MRFVIVPLVFFSISASCQKLTFLAGAQIVFPNGNLQNAAGVGAGIIGRFNYKLSERISAIGSIDGISFSRKSQILYTPSPLEVETRLGIETLQLGGRFNLIHGRNNDLYLTGELGLSGLHFSIHGNGNTVKTNEYDFCYRYGLGYSLKRWDARWSQQFISNGSESTNFFALQLGYLLYFKK